jgi:two-component system, NarL family, sensor histidine kinase UhpB
MAIGIRVLLVEDSESDAFLIERELKRSGYDAAVSRVDRQPELADALARGGWDIVLSDYNLPTLNGLDALREVRNRDPDLPFIIVSGAVGEEVAVDAMRAGAQDYVMKDNLARLSQAVRREIGDAENRRARKRVERALMESEERLRAVVAATRDSIYDRDLLTDKGWCNEAFGQLLGPIATEESFGQWWVSRVHPEDRDRALAEVSQGLRSGGSEGIEYRIRRNDGSYAHVLDRFFVLSDAHGKPLRMIGAIMDITQSKVFESEIRHANSKLKHLSAHILSIQENERRYIARELHDDVGQVLTALKIGIDTLARAGPPAVQGIPLGELADMANRALTQVRDITLALRPPQLDDLGLSAALRWHLDQQGKVSGWQSVFEADDLPRRLESNLETACFRIVQEALTNAARHGKPSRVQISLKIADDRLQVRVVDDGEGFDPEEVHGRVARGTSVGLAGMEERVTLARGKLDISSAPGQGTTVKADFPLVFRDSAPA